MNYLDGYIYHMVHFDTLRNIFLRQAILSKEKVFQEGLSYQSIANDEVQNLRDRVFVYDWATRTFKSLHHYVPFYFATHTPMLYRQFRDGIQDYIVLLEVNRTVLNERYVLFTDGNASNQQLSADGVEKVRIMPMMTEKDSCRRRYLPDGPLGKNINRSTVYGSKGLLDKLDWNNINERQWGNDAEKKRIKHAEVLVPEILSIARIENIYVKKYRTMWDVNALIGESKLKGHIPFATCKPELFF